MKWLPLMLLMSSAQALDLRPDTFNVELAHTSHVTQHFGDDPTNYGYDTALLVATWTLMPRLTLTVGDGAVLEDCKRDAHDRWCGGLFGPRETFTARVDFTLWRRQ